MMTTNDTAGSGRVQLSRPQDESLESYKAWIAGIFEHITGKPIPPEKDMSEEEWTNQHAEFWRKMHASEDEAAE
jgi:hypothetical protein